MQPVNISSALDKPLFDPTYINMEYVFSKIVEYSQFLVNFLTNPHTWTVLGIISAVLSILCIAVIIFSLVRLIEIQNYEKKEVDHEINEALLREKEMNRNANPRWHYIETLIESPNDSDWRVAVIEADSMMEEILKEKGLSGSTVSELLEGARESGYRSIQDAWNAHLIRNKIAHDGSDFPLSQVEGRRAIKMFQNFFEELRVI
jgi:large-conductance mechanosensitive channel